MSTGEENLANEVIDYLFSEGLLSSVLLGSLLRVTFLEIRGKQTDDNQEMQVEKQKIILSYRVDFLLTVTGGSGTVSRLVVECDGHDFHERTKEQAAKDRSRDRALQQAGYTVFRFTGSEIYRAPMKCARQIFKWAEDAAFKDGI